MVLVKSAVKVAVCQLGVGDEVMPQITALAGARMSLPDPAVRAVCEVGAPVDAARRCE